MTDKWIDHASCLDMSVDYFFDYYEVDLDDEGLPVRKETDEICFNCPVRKECLATGVGRREVGVWGGVYLINGKISREFNNHKTKKDWFEIWKSMAMETN